MSTNAGAIESTSDAVVSSEPPSNSDIAVSNGVTVVVGAESLDSRTETLATEPSSSGVIVQDLVDDSRVSGDETVVVMVNDEKLLDQSSSDAVVSSVPPAASNEVKIGDDLLESESGNRIIETRDHDGKGDIVDQDSVDDIKSSRDVTEIVIEKSELILDNPISDAVVSSVSLNNSDIDAANKVNNGADLLDSKTETLTMKPSADQNTGGDIAVMDLIDDSKVSGDEKVIVMGIIEKVSDENMDLVGVSRVSEDEKGIETEKIEKVSDANGVLNEEKEGKNNKSGDFVVQDSVDDSRVSGDEKEIVMENIKKVSDENEVINDKKEDEHIKGGDIAVQDSVNDSSVSGDEKEIVMENIEKISDQNEVINGEKEDEHIKDGDIVVQDSVNDSRVSGDEKEIVTDNIKKESDEIDVNNEEKEGKYNVTDIVWAKVKDYPWWPGQIFDPSSSTEVAKKHSNKNGYLVGYFGDQTFAWNKASKIKPFRKNFSKLGKQSNSKRFFHAVNCALDEVSRRVDFGLACSCVSKDIRDKIKSQVFVNAGIRKEASRIDGCDRFSTVTTFKPVNVVQSLQELAKEQNDGFDRLEVLSVRTQLLAFFRWKGYYHLQEKDIFDGVNNYLEDESEFPLMEENKVVEDEKLASVDEKVSSKKRKPDVCDSDDSDDSDSVPLKKIKKLTNVTPNRNSSVKRSISKKSTVKDEKIVSASKKVSSKKKKPDVSDSNDSDSVSRKKVRNLTNVTPKGNSSVKQSKKSKKTTVEDEKPASVGKKVSSKKTKSDISNSDDDSDSVSRKKVRNLINVTPKSNSSVKRSKKGKKTTVEDNIIEEENGDEKQGSEGKKVASRKRKLDDCETDDSVRRKKENFLKNMTPKGNSSVKRSKKSISKKETNIKKDENGNEGDNKKSSMSSPKKLFRVGDSICRIAKQISESPSIVNKESSESKSEGKSVEE